MVRIATADEKTVENIPTCSHKVVGWSPRLLTTGPVASGNRMRQLLPIHPLCQKLRDSLLLGPFTLDHCPCYGRAPIAAIDLHS